MKKLTLSLSILMVLTTFTVTPVYADFCIQMNGALSGDLGFFRFKGRMPKSKGAIKSLKGRVAGLSPVFGTATVAKDGSYVELGATFFADATQGQFLIAFFPPNATHGEGDASYGIYGVNSAVTADIVSCKLEP